MGLDNAIVQWLNKYQQLGIESFESLADGILEFQVGCAFNQLLNYVDPTFFSLASAKNLKLDSDNSKIQGHLIDMLEKIQQYRTNIQCKPPDYIEIDVQEIVIHKNKQQILAFFELILKVILSSNMRGKFIEPILMLDEKDQEILMHFLKNHLDETENQSTDWQEENYMQTLVQKMDELENQNNELKQSLNEQDEKVKSLKQSLDDAIIQMENRDMEIKSLTESKCYLEKCLEEKMDFQNEYKETEKIRQKCLEQEHKLAAQEFVIEDLKRKESQLQQLKEEYQQLKQQMKEIDKLEGKIESVLKLLFQLQERREFDKDVYQKGKERYEKEIANLKQNMKELLLQQSELKESRLNLELELQSKQARYERSQEQIKQMEQEYGQKIKELQDLLETFHQAEEEIQEQDKQLYQEMKSSVNLKTENYERDYYIKENHKLEEKIKELQAKLNELQMEEESKNQKREFEAQLQQSQQISLLTDKIKQFQDHNQQLKKQNEELKKMSQQKKVTQVDYEISVLSLLSEALARKVNELKVKD